MESDAALYDAALYYVDDVPHQSADQYLRLAAGVTRRPGDDMEPRVWEAQSAG